VRVGFGRQTDGFAFGLPQIRQHRRKAEAALIVDRLAACGISETSEAVINRLRQFSLTEVDLGKSFESNALKDFVVASA